MNNRDTALACLAQINPAVLEYDAWRNVGMILKDVGASVEDWDAWSQRDPTRYHAGECSKMWTGFNGENVGHPVGLGTLVKLCRDHGGHVETHSANDGTLARNAVVGNPKTTVPQNDQVAPPVWTQAVPLPPEPANWDGRDDLRRYVKAVFQSEDKVNIVLKAEAKSEKDGTTKYKPKGWGRAIPCAELIEALGKAPDLGAVIGNWDEDAGAWIKFNPVDGKGVGNANITAFRFALVECDYMEIEQQYAIYLGHELPIAALVHSGWRSLHAIVRIDAATPEEFKKRVKFLYNFCKQNGMVIDTQNKNPSRLSRLPGVTRGDKKQWLVATNIGKASWAEWESWATAQATPAAPQDTATPAEPAVAAEIQDIIDAEGHPFSVRTNQNNKITAVDLNPPALAKVHALRHVELFDPDENRFYGYDAATGLWTFRSPEDIRCAISTDVIELARRWFPRDDHVWTMVGAKRSGGALDGIANLAMGFMGRRNAFSRTTRHIIHCRNGVLDLDTMEFFKFSSEFYSRNQVPVDFNELAECPKFMAFISQSLDADDIDLLRRWVGTVVIGGNPCQAVMLLTGWAGGGKGTFCEILENIIGRQNVTELRTNHVSDSRFETYQYIGKTLLVGKDVRGGFLQERGAAFIKKLVGHDWITAEGKCIRDAFNIRGEFAVLIASNERLHVRLEGDCDVSAWQRRLNIVRYGRPPSYTKAIPGFSLRLVEEEGSGILNWLVSGALDVMKELQETGSRLRKTPAQQERVDALLSESTALETYLDMAVEAGDGDVAVSELTTGFFDFCNARGWRAMSSREVENRLPDLMLRMFSVAKSNGIPRYGKSARGWRGVVLKSQNTNNNRIEA